jgi:hypothetical protein
LNFDWSLDERFFSCGEFSPVGDKRTGLANLTKEISKLKKDIRHILTKSKAPYNYICELHSNVN